MIALATDCILALVVAEAAALVLLHRRTGQGVKPAYLLPNLAAGFFLVLATRLAASGSTQGAAGQAAIGAVLFAALLAHLLDLAARWRT